MADPTRGGPLSLDPVFEIVEIFDPELHDEDEDEEDEDRDDRSFIWADE